MSRSFSPPGEVDGDGNNNCQFFFPGNLVLETGFYMRDWGYDMIYFAVAWDKQSFSP